MKQAAHEAGGPELCTSESHQGASPPAAPRARAPGAAAQLGGGGGQRSPTGRGPAAPATAPPPRLRAASPPLHTSPPHRAHAAAPRTDPKPRAFAGGRGNPSLPSVSCRPHVASVSASSSRGRFRADLCWRRSRLRASQTPGPSRENPGRVRTSLISKPSGHTAPRLPAEAIRGRLAGCPVDRPLGGQSSGRKQEFANTSPSPGPRGSSKPLRITKDAPWLL